MFTMMNDARLAVGLQGVAIAEAATQQAVAYARERKQGRTPGMPANAGGADHRAAGRQTHAAHHARAHQRGARDLLCDRGRARPLASRRGRGRARRPRTSAHRC